MSRPQRPMALVGVLALMTALLSVSIFAPHAEADTTARKYYVDTTGDADTNANPDACENDDPDGDCTLRQAIEKSNVDGGGSTIDFTKLPTSDPNYDITTGRWTILPTQPLPALDDANGGTIILGRNDNPTFTPRIVLDGSSLAGTGNGIEIQSSGNIISRMIIVNFRSSSLLTGAGIRITGANAFDNQVVGSYIGNYPGILTQAGNQLAGILIDGGATTNRVGGSGSNRNVISGNGYNSSGQPSGGDGIRISGTGTASNLVQGNYIGTGLTTSFVEGALPNTGYGIQIADSASNTIGGDANGRNIISANTGAGILVTGSGSTGNAILSNYIGTGSDGLADFGNGQSGVIFENRANNNVIGNAPNVVVISGNDGYGVLITGNGTDANTVRDAYIGVNESAAVKVANGLGGVRIQENAKNNNIGIAGARNVISGNTGYGVSIGRINVGTQFTSGNKIRNNIIGLNNLARAKLENTAGGIFIDASARNTVIGGASSTEGNIISGNGPANSPTATGIIVTATDVVSTTITGNIIGLKRSVTNGPFVAAEGNQGGGILVAAGAQQVQIGGSAAQANRIDFNLGNGVTVNAGATNIAIRGNDVMTNTLGGISLTDVAGPVITHNRANDNTSGNGIQVSNAANAIVTNNTANGNLNGNGILVLNAANAQVTANTANGNKDAGGTVDGNGIAVAFSSRAVIKSNTGNRNGLHGMAFVGLDAANVEANTTNLNANSGILVDPLSTRTTLRFNQVISNTLDGINLSATAPFTMTENTVNENKQSGLLLTGPSTNSTITGNQFRLNKANGILVTAPSLTSYITFTENLIDTNTGSGLLLTGNLQNILVERNTFLNNTTNGLQAGGASAPHPQRVKMDRNIFIGNGIPANAALPVDPSLYGRGIVLTPKTVGAPGDPTNPNHDIDAPINSSLVISQNGVFTGNVLVDGSNAACGTDCTIQMFLTNPAKLDGQGAEFLSEVKPDANGKFIAPIGFVPAQIALTATDKDGNTSEFAVYTAKPAVTITAPQTVSAKPGQTVTIQHTVTNTGSVAFTNLQLFADKDKSDWTATPVPQAPFSLAPGETKIVSVTVSLPLGPANSVAAGSSGKISLMVSSGLTENASVSQTVEDTVQVLESVVLSVSPGNTSGSGKPGTEVVYTHNIINLGNTTATITYNAATTVNGLPAPTWTTSVSPAPTITLAPGQSAGIAVSVTVSPSAQAGPPPTVAQTKLTITPSTSSGVDASQIKEIIDTTTTTLNQLASLVPDRQGDSAATKTISFRHTIQNLSNGTATFKLSAVSSQGSQISFTTDTQGIEIVNGDTVTIPGGQQFSFLVNVTVARHVLPGQKDLVTVVLTDSAGGPIGGASVQDTINITQGVLLPRLYLPLVVRP